MPGRHRTTALLLALESLIGLVWVVLLQARHPAALWCLYPGTGETLLRLYVPIDAALFVALPAVTAVAFARRRPVGRLLLMLSIIPYTGGVLYAALLAFRSGNAGAFRMLALSLAPLALHAVLLARTEPKDTPPE